MKLTVEKQLVSPLRVIDKIVDTQHLRRFSYEKMTGLPTHYISPVGLWMPEYTIVYENLDIFILVPVSLEEQMFHFGYILVWTMQRRVL